MQLNKEEYQRLCDMVYNYPVINKHGFTVNEQKEIISLAEEEFKREIDMHKYSDAQYGVTCMRNEEGEMVIYHVDVIKSLLCGLESRNLTAEEWD